MLGTSNFFSGLVHNSMYCTVNQLCIFLPTRDPNALYSFKFLSVAMDTRLPRPADTALGISSLQISECFMRCFAHMPTGYLTNEGDTFNDSGLVEKYGNTFINVKDWGDFEQSDINRNGLTECPRFCRRRLNENWTASRVWPLTCVVCFFDYSLILMGHCRRMASSNLYLMLKFCVHISGLSIPSRIDYQKIS